MIYVFSFYFRSLQGFAFFFSFFTPFSLDPEHLVGSTIDQFLKISPPFHVFVIYSTAGPTPNEFTSLDVAKLGL